MHRDQEPAERQADDARGDKDRSADPGEEAGDQEDADAVLFEVLLDLRNLSGGRTYFWINFNLMSRIPQRRPIP